MSSIAIELNNVGKQYRLGRVGTGTLAHDLNRWFQTAILRRDDPYLKIGETNDRTTRGNSDYVWALRNISFQIQQGDVVGIIGKNGAGKSTLLKLLSHITSPSTGTIRYKGRIASLLEVGTGFHPELTGRENIYMNGSIMGMTKAEITRKLDEIVDFAGVERYLDTPVKRYSSGMTVRLGFAVAAFLEPEILVVDEVLTVGDAEFQKKAIGKMQDVSRGDGRTVLFVSHNMAAVRALCHSGIVLSNGLVEKIGSADECVDFYTQTSVEHLIGSCQLTDSHHVKCFSREVELIKADMKNDFNGVATYEQLEFELVLKRNTHSVNKIVIGVFFDNSSGTRISSTYTEALDISNENGVFTVRISVNNHQLAKGVYAVKFNVIDCWDGLSKPREYDSCLNVLSFEVKYVDSAHKNDFVYWPHRHMGDFLIGGTTSEIVG